MGFELQLWPKTVAGEVSFAHVDHALEFGLQVPGLLTSFPVPAYLYCLFPVYIIFISDWTFFLVLNSIVL